MSDDSSPPITVPEELKKKYPELVELILTSESMNDEERQYWVNILPVMTPEQVENLQQLLQNERKQLDAIDEKYEQEMQKVSSGRSIEEIKKDRDEKRHSRRASESTHEEAEREKELAILQAIESMGGEKSE